MKKMVGMIGMVLLLAACSGDTASTPVSIPSGNAEHGAELFAQSVNGAPACSTCHSLDGSALEGPSFGGREGGIVSPIDTLNAQQYVYESIVHPLEYLVDSYPATMYTQYNQRLSEQQIADLVAFVLAQ